MSIASELNALNGYILGAYDEINTKGGTVPANKNMANLASAIGSISTGSSTTIIPLDVTENGTYTAPTGTAYSPVTVNVSGGSGGGIDISAFRGCTKIEVGVYHPTSMNSNTIPHSLGLVPRLFALYETTLSSGGRSNLVQDLIVQEATSGRIVGGLCYNMRDTLYSVSVPNGMVSFSSTGVTISSTTYKMDTSVSYMYIVIG